MGEKEIVVRRLTYDILGKEFSNRSSEFVMESYKEKLTRAGNS